MNGESYLSFIPFHLSAIDCSPKIREWLISWASNQKLTFLAPDNWFQKGHNIIGWKEELDRPGNKLWKPIIKHNTYVWSPPPAVADVAVEELRKARLKRHKSTHIIIIPKLLTPYWRKNLYRCCDFVFEILPNQSFWNSQMHEPLFIGMCLPYLSCPPYCIRNTPKLQSLYREMRKMYQDNSVDEGNILYELLSLGRRLPSLSQSMVRSVLYFERQNKISPPGVFRANLTSLDTAFARFQFFVF